MGAQGSWETARKGTKSTTGTFLQEAVGLLSATRRNSGSETSPSDWVEPHPLGLTQGCRNPWELIIHTNQSTGCRPWPCKGRRKADPPSQQGVWPSGQRPLPVCASSTLYQEH